MNRWAPKDRSQGTQGESLGYFRFAPPGQHHYGIHVRKKRKRNSSRQKKTATLPSLLELPRALMMSLIVIVAFFVYLNSLSGGFVFDDTVLIEGNASIHGLDWVHLKEIFGGHYWQVVETRGGLYRPVAMWTYALNHAISGDNPEGYHVFNVLIHAANGLLVFLLVELLFQRRGLAFLSALLFVLHPIRTEGVASIVGRTESLSTLLLLAAWWGYGCYRRKSKGGAWLVLSLVTFFLATLTKESAYSFVALVPLTDYVRSAGERGKLSGRFPMPQTLWVYLAYALVLAASLGLRYWVLGGLAPLYINPSSNPLAGESTWVRFLTATYVFARYVWLLLFPLNLSADYSYNQIPSVTNIGSAEALLPLLLLLGVLVGLVRAANRSPFLFFCGMQFFCTFLLTSNWVRPIGTIMAERLLYFPSLGFSCAVAYLLIQAFPGRWRTTASILTVVLLAGYAIRTINRNHDWQDHFSLFDSAVRVSPDSSLVQSNYATILLNEKRDPRGAIIHARKALEIRWEDPAAWFTLGQSYEALGNNGVAAAAFEEVARQAPRTTGGTSALRRLALLRETRGEIERAIAAYRQLLEWHPHDAEARKALQRLEP